MNKRYLTATLIALISTTLQAQMAQQGPRLVVNIVIDQLSSDYIETFSPYFGTEGFKKLLEKGTVFEHASYPFSPIDRASAVAAYMTGASPFYNGITGAKWLDRNTLRPIGCCDDNAFEGVYTTDKSSPKNLLTSTVCDELKVASKGKAIVYAIAKDRDAAILSAGHAADGALWKDDYSGGWCSSTYYLKKIPTWLTEYNTTLQGKKNKTEFQQITELTDLAIRCIEQTGMGTDDIADMLNITLDASVNTSKKTNRQDALTQTYINLDRQMADLVATIENRVGSRNVVFFITGTGYLDEPTEEDEKYGIPSGTFYINRTANLLNMYLGAIYGSDRYVEGCHRNQIYLNLKLIEQKRLKINEILSLSQSFLLQCEGVQNVHTHESLLRSELSDTQKIRNGFHAGVGGNVLVEVMPGWKLYHEETKETFHINARTVNFPIVIYGASIRAQRIPVPTTIDRIAPTISKAIHIRAPNACASTPLF
ncbi:MAG: alkaline phosphatase family protein [Prevotellaceae bacterium]|nr:alkaline phosphatase family protein [Prevotella sp.]MDD7257248.1 alkaline phosphatase family protein [Prevotellaceae bacterium]MDY6130334.1 alkaline phosphatase family protein [Prevotella sp.]